MHITHNSAYSAIGFLAKCFGNQVQKQKFVCARLLNLNQICQYIISTYINPKLPSNN